MLIALPRERNPPACLDLWLWNLHTARVSRCPACGSGANLLSVCICLARGFVDFKRPGPRSKFSERWLLVRLAV